MKIDFKCGLNSKNITELVQKIKALKEGIKKFQLEYINLCLDEIQQMANTNLKNDSHFSGTTDINYSWHRRTIGNRVELYNDSDYAVIVEFGTGLVGELESTPLARTMYEYNVNGEISWTFIRDLTSLEWQPKIDYEDVKNNPDNYLIIKGFQGYEGKYYLYDAVIDFFNSNKYREIYQKGLDSILISL